ncbi:ABC transporter ATP-binding protein [Fusobacterium sp.]|uniref:ABC transporter ATP-binding protein n=1 Tax=Fusobacterium sp. TaxID=68766 RepID=UPI000C708938|nr:ABC transporter ATP-binding protein [Fusobacterium sp.]
MKILDLKKRYDDKIIFDGLNLDIEEEKITVILGQSGCGKTTLLNIICGFINDYTGEIKFESDIVDGMPYIFQEDALIPWKTVYKNIDYVLKNKIKEKDKREFIIEKYLKMVKLSSSKDSYPNSLSGGMKRRVGIARAFAFPSKYLLMDEPFEFLDVKTKYDIIHDFKEMQSVDKKTVILITHDIELAVALGDNIIILGSNPTDVVKEIRNSKENNFIKEEIEKIFL